MLNGSCNKCTDLLYSPPKSRDLSAVDRFAKIVGQKYNVKFDTYADLHKWSCENYDKFWEETLQFVGIRLSQGYSQVVDTNKRIDENPKWFEGCRLNYAENCLMNGRDDDIALYFTREGFDLDKDLQRWTFAQLRQLVGRYAQALRAYGVRVGDHVAGYMPNSVETAAAMFATTSIGAVWSSTSCDFGYAGVLERFSQIAPKVLFSVEAVVYKGRAHDHFEKLTKALADLPSPSAVVICPFTKSEESIDLTQLKVGEKAVFLSKFLSAGGDCVGELTFEQVPFDHPLFVMFSSGTTGKPKAMVHSAGGTLLKHMQEHLIQEDMTANDTIFFWTTCGWMMWNWLLTSLSTGAAVVLYDGSPFDPTPTTLFDIAERTSASILGMGAKVYDVFLQKKLEPASTHELSRLRLILSTGSPLKPSSFDYIYECIKNDVVIGSISGGTDIIACFMGACIHLPVYRGQCQCLYLGMNCQAWDDKQSPVFGKRGELVCLTPFPSMPTHFLNDDDGSRYRRAYFDKYPGTWAHGDYCIIDPDTGGITMLGRSDGTLNPGGVRFGSAELYNVVEGLDEIADSLAVGQKMSDGDERVVLFLVTNNGYLIDQKFIDRLKRLIRGSLSAKHVPALFIQVKDIPYTTSGKKVELAVKQVLSGEEVKNENALRNPESLDIYRRLLVENESLKNTTVI